jgi:Na+-driven multidrug efflux pump
MRKPSVSAQPAQHDPRTRALLEAPIARTLLRLAAPNVLVMLVQASMGLIETYFIGKLGTEALAGVALAFPVVMLMQMMSAGAMGGGISSAIARALGARRCMRWSSAACSGWCSRSLFSPGDRRSTARWAARARRSTRR